MNAPARIEPNPAHGLRAKFPDNQISKLPKETRSQIDARKADSSKMVWNCKVCGGHHHKDAVHLDYVGHAALTDRLLDVDPAWYWEPLSFDQNGLPAFDNRGGLWIKLTVCGITRLGYGGADGKQGTDAVKEIIGDALRNAAMRFGAALDLWHKGELHLDADEIAGGHSQEGAVGPQQPISDEQFAKLQQLIKATGANVKAICDYFKVDALVDLPASKFAEALDKLNTKLAQKVKAETAAKAKEPA